MAQGCTASGNPSHYLTYCMNALFACQRSEDLSCCSSPFHCQWHVCVQSTLCILCLLDLFHDLEVTICTPMQQIHLCCLMCFALAVHTHVSCLSICSESSHERASVCSRPHSRAGNTPADAQSTAANMCHSLQQEAICQCLYINHVVTH